MGFRDAVCWEENYFYYRSQDKMTPLLLEQVACGEEIVSRFALNALQDHIGEEKFKFLLLELIPTLAEIKPLDFNPDAKERCKPNFRFALHRVVGQMAELINQGEINDSNINQRIFSRSYLRRRSKNTDIYELRLQIPTLERHNSKIVHANTFLTLACKVGYSIEAYERKKRNQEHHRRFPHLNKHLAPTVYHDSSNCITSFYGNLDLLTIQQFLASIQNNGLIKVIKDDDPGDPYLILGNRTEMNEIIRRILGSDSTAWMLKVFSENIAQTMGKFLGTPAMEDAKVITAESLERSTLDAFKQLSKQGFSEDETRILEDGTRILVQYLERFPKVNIADFWPGNLYLGMDYRTALKRDLGPAKIAAPQYDVANYLNGIYQLKAQQRNYSKEFDNFLKAIILSQAKTEVLMGNQRTDTSKYANEMFKEWKLGVYAALFLRGTRTASLRHHDNEMCLTERAEYEDNITIIPMTREYAFLTAEESLLSFICDAINADIISQDQMSLLFKLKKLYNKMGSVFNYRVEPGTIDVHLADRIIRSYSEHNCTLRTLFEPT